MKKLLLGVLSLALALVPNVGFAAVDDFKISDYQIDYYLSVDPDGRSLLKTVERITADFPDFDQNHGIERAIPKAYDNHPTSLKISQIVALGGPQKDEPAPYSTYESNGNEVLRIGDPNSYAKGTHTYLLEYLQRDVIRNINESGVYHDEFFWDTNGIDWRVPIEKLTVRLHLKGQLPPTLNGQRSCYIGFAGENQRCEITDNNGVFTTSATNLSAHQNISIAFGFKAQTFRPYEPSLWERAVQLWGIILAASSFIFLGLMGWFTVRWSNLRNRKKEIGTIVPEYIPPKDISVTAAAEVLDSPHSVMTAQILDFAVRHYIRIIQTREKSTFKKAEYDLEIIKPIDDLKDEEQELLRDLFNGEVGVGSKMSMKSLQNSTAFYNRLQNNPEKLKKQVRGEYGLRAKNEQASKWFKRAGFVLLAVAVVLLSPIALAASITSFVLGVMLWQLTDKGLDLRRYLLGLKDYIGVAEEERIKMLQSPEGAAKVGTSINATDQSQLVKLYERVLPYAVLFGQEKEWNKQLGAYYEATGSQPTWYMGNNTAFNAAMFTSSMNNFSSSASYVSPSNSSSGGSGGGGFSGGGGGGGGGGGW